MVFRIWMILQIPLVLNVLFIMLSELSTCLLNLFNRNVILSTMDALAIHAVIFDALDASMILAAALHTVGAAGPSGINACRLCTSFCAASDEFCGAIALFAKRLCILHSYLWIFSPFLACLLIALDKSLGVWPIVEFMRCCDALWQRQLLHHLEWYSCCYRTHQLCAGQINGTEAANHAVLSVFNHDDSDVILLINVLNATNNSLNHSIALHNI